MTAGPYADYLTAVEALSSQADTLAKALDRAELLGHTELDAASARVRDAEGELKTVSERLRSANDLLARLSRQVGFDLEPTPPRQAAPRTLADADRLLADLQRELTAIERNCEWVRRNRSVRSQAAPSRPVTTQPGTPAALAVPIPAALSPVRPAWQSPMVWIVAALAVLVVIVLVLILR